MKCHGMNCGWCGMCILARWGEGRKHLWPEEVYYHFAQVNLSLERVKAGTLGLQLYLEEAGMNVCC